jgi:hypothetical protein
VKRTVAPHDLRGACKECGTSLSKLSENTGIPEDELLLFAAGRVGLLARERFGILLVLMETAPPPAVLMSSWRSALAMKAHKELVMEIVVEDLMDELDLW